MYGVKEEQHQVSWTADSLFMDYKNELGYLRPSKKVNKERQKRNLEQISKHFQSIQLSLKLGIVTRRGIGSNRKRERYGEMRKAEDTSLVKPSRGACWSWMKDSLGYKPSWLTFWQECVFRGWLSRNKLGVRERAPEEELLFKEKNKVYLAVLFSSSKI